MTDKDKMLEYPVRYDQQFTDYGIVESKYGEYIKFSDHDRLLQAAKESYRKELEAAIKQRDFYKDAKRKAETDASDAINSLKVSKQLCEKLKREAQMNDYDARGAKSTIAEIYQYISGATGERGDWNGASPVIEAMEAAKQRIAELEATNNFDATILRRLCAHFGLGGAVPVSDEELLQVAGTVIGSVLRVAEKNRADDRKAVRDELQKVLSEQEQEGTCNCHPETCCHPWAR